MAPVVIYLLSDAAAGVNGQFIRLTGRSDGLRLGIVDPPRPGVTLTRAEWSEDDVAVAFDATRRHRLAVVGAHHTW